MAPLPAATPGPARTTRELVAPGTSLAGAAVNDVPAAQRSQRSAAILSGSDPLGLRLSAEATGAGGAGQHANAGGPGTAPGSPGPAARAFGRCSCPACTGAARSTSTSTTTASSDTASAAPSAAVSLQTLASYLTGGFWQEVGSFSRRYNLSSSGTGARAGTLTYNITGWANDSNGLSADRQALAREVFKTYAAVLGINFQEVTGAGGDFRFTDNDGGAYAYLASGWYDNAAGTSVTADYSVINVEASWFGGQSNYNTYTPQTFFHEIGHALGLGHQGRYNYTGSPLTYATSAQFANDSWQATMMSYWDQVDNSTTGASFAWLQTPMAVDWIALNDLYGGYGFSTANAFQGDTIYGVGTTIGSDVSRIWNEFSTYAGATAYTLVDGSGYDTLNVSNFTADQLINLAPSLLGSTTPSRSNIGGKIGNLTIAANTIIEAAIGGAGNDVFYGNDAANNLRGGGGNDSFYDSPGSDVYFGEVGNDWLYFSESLSLFSYSLDGGSLRFSRLSGSADVDLVWDSTENLSFGNAVYTYQQLLDSLGSTTLPTPTIQTVNGSLASGALTNATALLFQGSLSRALASGESIAFFRNGIQVGSASPAAEGDTSWSFAYQEASGTSTITYSARVLAASGDSGALSNGFLLSIDTEAPVVSVNNLDTYSTTPLLSGAINDPAARVNVSIGSLTRTALNNGNGSWSLQWSDPLAAGQTYDVVVLATDAAGNSGNDSSSGELIVRADDYSADSSSSGRVSVGGSSSGTLETNGDHDWFGIDLQLGRSYEFRLNGVSLIDPHLRLYSAGGNLLASNDDASTSTLNSLISFTATSSGRFYLDAGAYNEAGSGSYSLVATDVTPAPTLYFSLANNITSASAAVLGGITARTNDIIAFNGSSFSVWLNGNASGLTGAVLRDFDVINPNEVVVAFNAAITLAGIAFEPTDLARLSRTGSGFAITMMLDGSDVGLTTSGEAIDAVTGLADGSWLISTRGAGSVPSGSRSLSFAAEDLLRFTPTSLGANTAGSWSLYADMSRVGLTTTNSNLAENVVAVDVNAAGRVVLVSQGNASATGLNAANEDAFAWQPSRLGANTAGSFLSPLVLDGSVHGLATNALMGIDLAA